MKLALRLTMDGLIRALRVRAHELAEAAEENAADDAPRDEKDKPDAGRRD